MANCIKTSIDRKYYKYVTVPDEYIFNQPQLYSDGVMGGTDFAVGLDFGACNDRWGQAYRIFQPNNTDTAGFYCDEYKGWMKVFMYIPHAINFTRLDFYISEHEAASGAAYNVYLWAGNSLGATEYLIAHISTVALNSWYSNGSLWSPPYQYFMLYLENGGTGDTDRLDVNAIYTHGEYHGTKTVIQESTSTDYDFYADSARCYGFSGYHAIH